MPAHGRVVPRLTDQQYWDEVHLSEERAWTRAQQGSTGGARPEAAKAPLKARIKRLLGRRLLDSIRAYDDYLLWDVILPEYLAGKAGARVVEIGSAPGDFLVRLHQRFGLAPHGIEYSPAGVELNRRIFAADGIDPAHVIHADFLAPEVHERYRESFDIVLSRGFIEHFRDVDDVIRKHLSLLRRGGLLVVLIPNLKGANLLLSWLFHRQVVAMHNLEIMARDRFAALFPEQAVQPLFCDYYGTFSFFLFNTRPGSPMRWLLQLCMKLQLPLNVLFRFLLKGRRAESPWFSPNLLFIGIKR